MDDSERRIVLNERITKTLQQIDANYVKAHEIATSLLERARTYSSSAQRAHDALEVWKKLFDGFMGETASSSAAAVEAAEAEASIPVDVPVDISIASALSVPREKDQGGDDDARPISSIKKPRFNDSIDSIPKCEADISGITSLSTPSMPSFTTSFAKTPMPHPSTRRLVDVSDDNPEMRLSFSSPPMTTPFYKPSKTPGRGVGVHPAHTAEQEDCRENEAEAKRAEAESVDGDENAACQSNVSIDMDVTGQSKDSMPLTPNMDSPLATSFTNRITSKLDRSGYFDERAKRTVGTPLSKRVAARLLGDDSVDLDSSIDISIELASGAQAVVEHVAAGFDDEGGSDKPPCVRLGTFSRNVSERKWRQADRSRVRYVSARYVGADARHALRSSW